MKAFLKRRWILLSCVVVLIGCSCFDLRLTMSRKAGMLEGKPTTWTQSLAVFDGRLCCSRFRYFTHNDGFYFMGFHWPTLGCGHQRWLIVPWREAAVPLWLPLTVI